MNCIPKLKLRNIFIFAILYVSFCAVTWQQLYVTASLKSYSMKNVVEFQ